MDSINEVCKKHRLICIEDCAQSFGAVFQNRQTGSFGDAGCFSFFPSKNLGAFGDGGMIVTSDEGLAEEVRSLRNHGSKRQYIHSTIGYNSRLDEFQAAVLLPKLSRIDTYNAMRRESAARYTARLSDSGLTTPFEDSRGTHVYHQYTIRAPHRTRSMDALSGAGIASAIYYPVPLHRQEVFQETYRDQKLPHAEKAAEEVMSLPIFPELTADQIDLVCETLLSSTT
jgi:dTDP-4-amino-4,6-dideoxygalactose transaminase